VGVQVATHGTSTTNHVRNVTAYNNMIIRTSLNNVSSQTVALKTTTSVYVVSLIVETTIIVKMVVVQRRNYIL